jgi:hypothetical protein
MKPADFRSELTPNGQIAVPPEILAQVSAGFRGRRRLVRGGPTAI